MTRSPTRPRAAPVGRSAARTSRPLRREPRLPTRAMVPTMLAVPEPSLRAVHERRHPSSVAAPAAAESDQPQRAPSRPCPPGVVPTRGGTRNTPPDASPAQPARHPATHPGRRVRDPPRTVRVRSRSEEHTSELQSRVDLVCRLLLEKKKGYVLMPKVYYTQTITGQK